MNFDLVIIGAGPAGIKAAAEGAALGLKTALIERGFIGGACLNSGCVPTKFLLGATAAAADFAAQKKLGLVDGQLNFNLEAIHQRKDKFLKSMREAAAASLERAGVTLLRGKAVFSGPKSVSLALDNDQREIGFGKAMLATGSAPTSLPNLRPDGGTVLSSSGLLAIRKAPKSLLILGCGAIGVELGEFFHRLGTKITVVEGKDQILCTEDPEVSQVVHQFLEDKGWEIHTGKAVVSLATTDNQSLLTFSDGSTLSAELSLAAIGRKPLSQGLGLEAAGVEVNARGAVNTDSDCRTSNPDIYAIGDVNGKLMLANAAEHQAELAVSHAFGARRAFSGGARSGETQSEGAQSGDAQYNVTYVPSCIYGDIEVMRVGPTLAELKNLGLEVKTTRAALSENTVTQAAGHSRGFVKVAWVDGRIRSICAVGHGVSHLVLQSTIMVKQHWTKNNVKDIIFTYPALDEALKSAMVGIV